MPINVTNVAELSAAIANAKAGDEIVLAAGTYALGNVNCTASGSAASPIVVRSATPLAARIDFNGLEGFRVSGAHWQFEGLDVHGVCVNDANCEHAFHVFGGAIGFVMRGNRVVDFNAQLKVNATVNGVGNAVIPHQGLVEYNELFDTHARNTAAPVTKLNIDTGDDWVVRGNYIHDFHKVGTDVVTYGAFLKSGGKRGLVERNLVVCSKDLTSEAITIGLSFGGGGTGNAFCAPAFDANVTCLVEHEDGTMRNNIVASCADVGVYLNRSKNSRIVFNTLIATAGIDFRYDTSSGEARGNLYAGVIRNREQSTGTFADNLLRTQGDFDAMYTAPLIGDLRLKTGGDVSALVGKSAAASGITDDYCARPRGAAPLDLGALESSLGDCTTVPPPKAASGSNDAGLDGLAPGADGGGASSSGGTSSGGASSGGGSSGSSGGAGEAASDDGCGCRTTRARSAGFAAWLAACAIAFSLWRRRR